MKYVATYVPKFSDSFANDWLNDGASDYSMGRKILFDYHPLEPEMWLQLAAKQFPCCFSGGTMLPIVAPYPGMERKPAFVERYEACTWRGADMTLLEYLRKTNDAGEPLRHIKEAFKAQTAVTDLYEFARDYSPKGEKLVAAETFWRMNDKFYGQWLALHVPFRHLEDLEDETVEELVPENNYHLAAALRKRPNYWRDLEQVRDDMELEAVASAQVETVLKMIKANTHMIDQYLKGQLKKHARTAAEIGAAEDTGPRPEDLLLDPRQTMLLDNLKRSLKQTLAIETEQNPREAEELREQRARTAKIIVALGPPGTGKSMVLKRMITRTLRKGGRVLVTFPTGQLASRLRQEFGKDVAIDTCHGAFLLHRPEQEALPLLSSYDLIAVDEFPQLEVKDFDRIVRMWEAVGKVPTIYMAGDFHQLPGISGTSPKDSKYWNRNCIHQVTLDKSWRSTDDVLLDKLSTLRTQAPSPDMIAKICRNHKAWSDHHYPTAWDIQTVFRNHPETTVVTCTRRGANLVNDLYLQAKFGNRPPMAVLPTEFDANEDNFDKQRKLRGDRRPRPKMLPVHRGMRVHLTRNLNKEHDFVNGMEGTIEDYDEDSECLRIRTKTGRLLAGHKYTDPETKCTFFPIRAGYASTIYKMQGAQLPHVTIWLDKPGVKAAAYVAMSRVRRDNDYLLGGIVTKKHLVPNA